MTTESLNQVLNSDTTDLPESVIAIEFDDPLLAREALMAANRLGVRKSLELDDAAIVSKVKGKVRILQTRDTDPIKGGSIGFWWGGLAGLLVAGLFGWLGGALIGAAAGWAFGRYRDIGINDDFMRSLGTTLQPGNALAVFQIPFAYPTHLLRELRRFNGKLVYNTLSGIDDVEVTEALAYS